MLKPRFKVRGLMQASVCEFPRLFEIRFGYSVGAFVAKPARVAFSRDLTGLRIIS